MNQEFAEQNKKFQSLLKKATFSEAIEELLKLREMLFEEILSWRDLPKEHFTAMPFPKANGYHSKTVAYSLWHIFRIEDIVVNTLIQRKQEVLFSGDYLSKTHSPIRTTANELVGNQIEEFSKLLSISDLYDYISEVKTTTDNYLKTISYSDVKQSYSDEDKRRIEELEVVSKDPEAIWLIDYWCGKDLKGLLQMPLSRHWIMHIEASLRILAKLQK